MSEQQAFQAPTPDERGHQINVGDFVTVRCRVHQVCEDEMLVLHAGGTPGVRFAFEGRAVRKAPDQPKEGQKTIRVRIAVAVRADGVWGACPNEEIALRSANIMRESSPIALHFIEADVPLPASETIQGEVKP